MRISRLSMDGFGIFRDVDVRDLPPGLSLFLGDNETGKSTTLAFVHTVLFGYPDGRTKEKVYQPLRGGDPGGRLVLETDSDGQLSLERRDGKKGGAVTITFPDGHSEGHPALARLLGGTTRHLYRNLYGFSLSELQDLETLTDAEVKEVIYGASLGASARSLPEARKRLEGRMGELYRPSGSKPKINVLLKDLEEVRGKLREAGRGISEYEELAGTLAGCEQSIGELRTQLVTDRETHERLKARVGLWDDWMELQDAEERLEALPQVVESFPDEGLTRLEGFVRQLDSQQDELRGSEEDLGEKNGQLKQLVLDQALMSKGAEIRVLVRGLVTFEKAVTEIPRAEERLKSMRRQTREVLTEFGAGWTEERVLALDRSPMVHEQIEEHREALEEARRQLEKARDCEEELRTAAEQAAAEDEKARKAVTKLQGDRIDVAPETLAALRERREQFSGLVRDVPKVELQRGEAVDGLQQLLRGINPAWTPETLEEFDGSLTSRQKVTEIETRLSDAGAQERDARNTLERANATLAETEQAVTRQAKEIEEAGAGAIPLEVLRERKGRIRSMRDAVTRSAAAKTELRAHQQAAQVLRSVSTGDTGGEMGRRLQIVAAVAGVLALTVGPALWFAVGPEVGGTAGGILFLAALALFVVGRSVFGRPAGKGGLPAAEDDRTIRQLQARLKTITAEITGLQEKLDVTGEEIDTARVDDLEDENIEQMRVAGSLTVLQDNFRKLEEARQRASTKTEAAIAGVEDSRIQCETAEADWKILAKSLKLPPETAPRTAGHVFEKAETARSQARQIADLDRRLSDMRAMQDAYLELMKSASPLEAVAREGTNEQRITTLAEFLADMDREEKDVRLLADASLAAKRAAEQLAAAKDKQEASAREHHGAAEADQAIRETWAAWLREHQMGETWSSDVCLRLLDRAVRLADLAAACGEAEEEVKRLSGDKDVFEEKAATLCRSLGRLEPPADKLATEVHSLEASLEENSSKRTLHKSLSADIPGLEARCGNRRKRIEELETAISELVASGGAGDKEEFRSRGRLFAERQNLLNTIENHAGNVRKLSGQSDMKALREALAEATRPGLQAAQTEAEGQVQDAVVRLEALQQEHARTDERRKQFHDEDAIARLRADEESLLEKFRESADDWARHAVALHLLSTAKERFEKAHQPEVIRHASGYFSSITGGRYTQVFVPHDGAEEIEVIDAQGSRKPVTALSRGTSEQLYLAIRFGYIESHRRGGETLPILMDDVLVNFDPLRASRAAEGILGMARSHQILFFTCHPETVEIFRRHRPDVPVHLIANDSISGPAPLPPPSE